MFNEDNIRPASRHSIQDNVSEISDINKNYKKVLDAVTIITWKLQCFNNIIIPFDKTFEKSYEIIIRSLNFETLPYPKFYMLK